MRMRRLTLVSKFHFHVMLLQYNLKMNIVCNLLCTSKRIVVIIQKDDLLFYVYQFYFAKREE